MEAALKMEIKQITGKEIIACAKCGQKCRVPKAVKIEIKCSNCSFKWTGSY
jgi:DNA-directed RNA polymerase subunit RPC12/RpoP